MKLSVNNKFQTRTKGLNITYNKFNNGVLSSSSHLCLKVLITASFYSSIFCQAHYILWNFSNFVIKQFYLNSVGSKIYLRIILNINKIRRVFLTGNFRISRVLNEINSFNQINKKLEIFEGLRSKKDHTTISFQQQFKSIPWLSHYL